MVFPAVVLFSACRPAEETGQPERVRIDFEVIASVQEKSLNEISGIEVMSAASDDGLALVVHNDDGEPLLWLLDQQGEVLRKIRVKDAKNRDWEDITRITTGERTLLAIGDIGDNLGIRSSIRIYFIEWPPPPGSATVGLAHKLKLTYPDGARDCEALAFDPSSKRLMLMTKRDKPPRLYSVALDAALVAPELELEYLGTMSPLRSPTREDMLRLGKDGSWISQPTGLDISDDGNMAAVITYRSLYLFSREPGRSWEEVFQTRPREFLGPASNGEEAIAFEPDGKALIISSEDQPAPLYRVELPPPLPGN